MLKVLLLGSTGLLGSAVKEEFSEFDLLTPGRQELDVTNSEDLESYIEKIAPDLVINCTGYNAVDDAEKPENRDEVFELNEKVPMNLALLSEKFGFKLIQFSSDYVFDGSNSDGYSIDSEYGPINVYGESKMAGELAVLENCSKCFVVRISWLFGPGKKNFVTTMLDLASTRDSLSVVGDQVGKPTYTEDVAKALRVFTDSTDYGIHHLPNEGTVSWFEFTRDIFEIAGVSIELNEVSSEEFKRLAQRPKSSILINSRLPMQRSYREALEDYIKTYL